VRADAWFPVAHPACARLELATLAMIRDQLHGSIADLELDAHAAAVASEEIDLVQPPMIAAWGRKPG
jgi:hypothetical protein